METVSLNRTPRLLRVVLASPGDVQDERKIAPIVIEELNKQLGQNLGFQLVLYKWETDTHPGFHSSGPQGLIDEKLRIQDSDVVVGVFWKRFGTPVPGAESGTVHELRNAIEAWRKKKTPQIMVYFKSKAYSPKNKSEAEQWAKVLAFKDDFPNEGLWWQFKNTLEFERLLRGHLTNFLLSQPLHGISNESFPDSEELPDRQAYLSRYLDLIHKAQESILLNTSIFHKVQEVNEAPDINAALGKAKDRNVRVQLIVADGYDRLPGAVELSKQYGIEVRFDPATHSSDISYACVDRRHVILASRLPTSHYQQSTSWTVIESNSLAEAITKEFNSRWESGLTKTLEQQLRTAVPPIVRAASAEQVSEQLGLPLKLIQYYSLKRAYVIFLIGRPGSGKSSIARILRQNLLEQAIFQNVHHLSDLPFLSGVFSKTDGESSTYFEKTPDDGFFITNPILYEIAIEHLAREAAKLLAHSDLLLIEFARKFYVAAFELLKSKGIEPDVAIYIETDFNTALERNRRRPQLEGADRHYVSEQEMIQTFKFDDFAELVQKYGEKVLAVDNVTEVSAVTHAAARVFQKIRSVFEYTRIQKEA